mmetsp:Transcript_22459/g.53380  ORF Transcript_22459/g.53380 Transcript_22459/m.53380 type:complete len:193 (+) Transcript_22459:67-645(+)
MLPLICKIILSIMILSECERFSVAFSRHTSTTFSRCNTSLSMGLFDGIAKAFSNENFKGQDQRVRASHILIKSDDSEKVLETVRSLLGELQDRTVMGDESLPQIFAELARRESQCPSKDNGGDLGVFGKGKMVKEFDEALFPDDASLAPPAGNVLGPVITDFGAHIILITKRDENKDQVEEKLARIDPDAAL